MGKFSFAGVDVEGLFIHPQAVDVMELLQLSRPLRCFVETIDLGEVAGKFVDCFARLGPDPRKVDTSGVNYATLASVAEVAASKTSGATRLHQEWRLRVL